MRRIIQTFAAAAVATLVSFTGSMDATAQDTRVVKVEVLDRTATGPDVVQSGGTEVVRVTQGDNVEIRWTSDEATELHLHGYNVETEVTAEGEAVMTVEARAAGRFAIEGHGFSGDHKAKKTLLYLEVLPR